MKRHRCSSPREAISLMRTHAQEREKNVRAAASKAASKAAARLRATAPGELADHVVIAERGNTVRVVVDHPAAAAVDQGSRPHTPPLEPLIASILKHRPGIGERGARAAAIVMQRTIASQGTHPHPFMADASAEMMRALDEAVREALERGP